MQRDFSCLGGFGAALGKDVSPLAHTRGQGWLELRTREARRPDLFDFPPAKIARGQAALRIGEMGIMGSQVAAQVITAGRREDPVLQVAGTGTGPGLQRPRSQIG